jgi:hypothetical protein
MNHNALQTMIVPIVRGVFLMMILAASTRGLVWVLGRVAVGARRPHTSLERVTARNTGSA